MIRILRIGEIEMEKIKTKDKILLAALDLFSERGYDEASIDLIAEAVGIKGPSIYAHYKGKEDILDSLIFYCFICTILNNIQCIFLISKVSIGKTVILFIMVH